VVRSSLQLCSACASCAGAALFVIVAFHLFAKKVVAKSTAAWFLIKPIRNLASKVFQEGEGASSYDYLLMPLLFSR